MLTFTSQGTTVTPTHKPRRPALRASIAVALAAAIICAASIDVAAAAAPVPCWAAGGGKYNCRFYPSGGAPVQLASGYIVGTLHQGTNWVLCQRVGSVKRSGQYYNNNWAWTLADNNRWGWVNAVHARGGDNNGPFAGVPSCGSTHGNPPYSSGGGRTPS